MLGKPHMAKYVCSNKSPLLSPDSIAIANFHGIGVNPIAPPENDPLPHVHFHTHRGRTHLQTVLFLRLESSASVQQKSRAHSAETSRRSQQPKRARHGLLAHHG